MKRIGIIQARMGSTRLPGKMLEDLGGQPLLYWVLRRCQKALELNAVVLATSTADADSALTDMAQALNCPFYRGSESDVLNRFAGAAENYGADTVVRICADNPLIAPEEIDRIIKHYIATDADYAFNHIPALNNHYPDGLGAEVFSSRLLYQLAREATLPAHREHTTQYIWDHSDIFTMETLEAPPEISAPEVKLDVDTPDDLQRMRTLVQYAPPGGIDHWTAADIVKAYHTAFNTAPDSTSLSD